MKIRLGFVSNSSTTSFTCCVCGETETGMDVSLYDIDWYQCVNEHCLCPDDLLEDVPESDDEEWRDHIPEACCPVCKFTIFTDKDLANYLERLTNVSRADAFAQVKQANKRRKKLYDNEYVMYACDVKGLTREGITNQIKQTFTTYRDLGRFLGYKYWD
jgi:hypothetical protein